MYPLPPDYTFYFFNLFYAFLIIFIYPLEIHSWFFITPLERMVGDPLGFCLLFLTPLEIHGRFFVPPWKFMVAFHNPLERMVSDPLGFCLPHPCMDKKWNSPLLYVKLALGLVNTSTPDMKVHWLANPRFKT